ncbi:MAG: hypothetical protein ACQETB_05340 [Halobacteriota archaeon]
MTRSIQLDADLTLTNGSESFAVHSTDDRLVVDAPSFRSLRSLRSLWKPVSSLPIAPTSTSPEVNVADLSIAIRVRRSTVAVYTGGKSARPLGGLGSRGVSIRLRGVIVAAVRLFT